jgi:hypothetical protein
MNSRWVQIPSIFKQIDALMPKIITNIERNEKIITNAPRIGLEKQVIQSRELSQLVFIEKN